jgi:Domain of unknown function (DUF4124)
LGNCYAARMMRMRMLCLSLMIAAFWLRPETAAAQVNRCTTNSGATVYTDRPCSAIGASERLPRGAAPSGTGARRVGCARNLQDLIYEITSAVDQRDVNRIGAVYHWVGMNAVGGNRVLDRLQAIVDRPLVDIVVIRSAGASAAAPRKDPDAQPNAAATPFAPASSTSGASGAPSAIGDESPAVPPPRRRGGPVGLRLEQTLRNSATPSRTVLGLRRHLDCWWVVLPGS